MSTVHTIQTPTHGRYLVHVPDRQGPHPLVVGFHGYGENAAIHLRALERTAGNRDWVLVSVQALNRFYTRGDRDVVASWMTREDRDVAIADNVAYVRAVVDEVRSTCHVRAPLVFAGFSQGVAMAYRASAFGGLAPHGLIVLAGDVPPDVAPVASQLSRILQGCGRTDEWYTPERAEADRAALQAAGAEVETLLFDGGHEWTDEFAARAGGFLDELSTGKHRNEATRSTKNN